MSGGSQSQPEPGGKKKNRFPCHELKPSHPVHRRSLLENHNSNCTKVNLIQAVEIEASGT
jgi:hypothetical protein